MTTSGALFPSLVPGSRGSSNKYLVEFRAGKMSLKGTTVTPDKRKGLVYIQQTDDSLIHFCWKDRTSGNVEDVSVAAAARQVVAEPSRGRTWSASVGCLVPASALCRAKGVGRLCAPETEERAPGVLPGPVPERLFRSTVFVLQTHLLVKSRAESTSNSFLSIVPKTFLKNAWKAARPPSLLGPVSPSPGLQGCGGRISPGFPGPAPGAPPGPGSQRVSWGARGSAACASVTLTASSRVALGRT